MTTIQIFKTSVQRPSHISLLSNNLDKLVQNGRWNFDLYDCDNILRIQTTGNITNEIIRLLTLNGFSCEELAD